MTDPDAPRIDVPYIPGPTPPSAEPQTPTPPTPIAPATPTNRRPLIFAAGGLAVGLMLGAAAGGIAASQGTPAAAASPSPVVTTYYRTDTVYVTVPAAPPTTATVAAAAAGPVTSFGDGIYEVNVDIAPGTYKTRVPETSRNCYWERMKDFSGVVGSIAANDNLDPGSPATVKIVKSDVGFKSSGCGTWTKTG